MKRFSYDEYKEIIKYLSTYLNIIDFKKITKTSSNFLLLRHDIEFSVTRALGMGELEKDLSVKSSYFFQMRNSAYNIASRENIKIIKELAKMGHKIGLHVHKNGNIFKNKKQLEKFILDEKNLFEKIVGLKIDRYSFHRPNYFELESNLEINNLVNTYHSKYFTFFKHKKIKNPHVKYYSDSLHKWEHGHPLKNNRKYKKIQLLTHPYSWSKNGSDNRENFKRLIKENKIAFIENFSKELKKVPKL